METINCGIVGAGARALIGIYKNINKYSGGRTAIKAFFDPGTDRIAAVQAQTGGADAVREDSFEKVIDNPAVNAVIIATPNAFHAKPAVYAMEKGKLIFLEKPIAAILEDSRIIMEAKRRTRARLLLGFCMRHCPFYTTLHKIVSSGRLGKIISVHAEEHMGIILTGDIYLRSPWRRNLLSSGPLLLEKCCHDIDMLNWMLNSKCLTVFSVNDRTVFLPRKDAPDNCSECKISDCQYRAKTAEDFKRQEEKTGEQVFNAGYKDSCVYNTSSDVADHTTLLARYEGGIHVTFNVSMGAGETRRNIKILGSKSCVEGCLEEGRLYIRDCRIDAPVETVEIKQEEGGHHGADQFIAREFISLFDNPQKQPNPSVEEGYESARICFAAEKSAIEGVSVRIGDL